MPADDSHVDIVRRAFADFEVQAGTLEEYFARYYAPDGVVEFVDGFPIAGRYEGADGYRRWFEDSYAPYEDVKRELHSIEAVADRVVALITITGRAKDDPTELEIQLGNTYELGDDGRIRHLRIYVGHARAKEAARNGG
jgi:ketosteroid isomerase-like protein